MRYVRKAAVIYTSPSRELMVHSVVTSAAISTGQSPDTIRASLKTLREKFAHLRLAV